VSDELHTPTSLTQGEPPLLMKYEAVWATEPV
jgi:hypothetical protein